MNRNVRIPLPPCSIAVTAANQKTGIPFKVEYRTIDAIGFKDNRQLALMKDGVFDMVSLRFLQNSEDAVASAIVNYGGGARALEDAIRRAGNIQWDANLRRLRAQGLISEDTFSNTRMNRNDMEEGY